MATPTVAEIDAAIRQAILDGFSTVTIGGQTVSLESAKARIEALKELQQAEAETLPNRGMAIGVLKPRYQ